MRARARVVVVLLKSIRIFFLLIVVSIYSFFVIRIINKHDRDSGANANYARSQRILTS